MPFVINSALFISKILCAVDIIASKNDVLPPEFWPYIKVIGAIIERTIGRLIEFPDIELVDRVKKILSNEKDIDLKKTDKLLKIILFSAVFELMFKHNTPKNVIISEYVLASEFFLEKAQISYLNAILDKLSKLIREE